MRVVDVTSFFAETCGGIKSYYRDKARHLPGLGLDCHFVVPGTVAATEAFGDATLHRLPGTPLFGSRMYRRFTGLAPLRALLARLRPDVIELGSHYVLPDLVRLALTGWTGPRPILVGFYHADFPRTYVAPLAALVPGLGRAAVAGAWALVRRQHSLYRATLVASRHIAVALAAHGVPDVRWVGLGVDLDTFRPRPRAPGPPRLVYAGRLSPEKGVGVLLDAAVDLHRATGAELVVAGDGPLAPRLRKLADEHAFIRPVGNLVGREQVAELVASADAVIAPGPHETFSLSAAEAMACAVPVVGADRGGNGELLADSAGGVSFPAGSAAGLTASVVRLLRQPAEAREALGRRGHDHVSRRYGWDQVARRIAGVYAEVGTP